MTTEKQGENAGLSPRAILLQFLESAQGRDAEMAVDEFRLNGGLDLLLGLTPPRVPGENIHLPWKALSTLSPEVVDASHTFVLSMYLPMKEGKSADEARREARDKRDFLLAAVNAYGGKL